MRFVCDADDICDCRDWTVLVEVSLYIELDIEADRSKHSVDSAGGRQTLDICEI